MDYWHGSSIWKTVKPDYNNVFFFNKLLETFGFYSNNIIEVVFIKLETAMPNLERREGMNIQNQIYCRCSALFRDEEKWLQVMILII